MEHDYYLDALKLWTHCNTGFIRNVPKYECDKRRAYVEMLEAMMRVDMDISNFTYDEFIEATNRNTYREALYLWITNKAQVLPYTGTYINN